MRNLQVRLAIALVLVFSFWIPTSAAFPAIVMIYGEPLDRPLFVTLDEPNVEERFGFLVMGDDAAPVVSEADLRDRAFLRVAMFWGGSWTKYLEDRRLLSTLRPEDAAQHGRLYLPTATQSAVALKTPGGICVARRSVLPSGRGGRPVPTDAKDFSCGVVKLTPANAQAVHDLGIPGF